MSLFDEIQDERPNGLSKDLIVYELRKFVIEPYFRACDPDYRVDKDDETETDAPIVKPNELLKAIDQVCKLKGYYDTVTGDDLPDVVRLKKP